MKQLHLKYAIVFVCGSAVMFMSMMYGSISHTAKMKSAVIDSTLIRLQVNKNEEPASNIGDNTQTKTENQVSTSSSTSVPTPVTTSLAVNNTRNLTVVTENTQEADQRINIIKSVCNKTDPGVLLNDVQSILKQHQSNRPRFYFSDKYNFMICEIPKCGSTNWKKLLVSMEGETNATDPMKIPGGEAHILGNKRYLWKYFNESDTKSRDFVEKRIKNYTHIMTVREPMERLVSAYIDKMLPTGSGGETYLEISRRIHAQYRETTNSTSEESDELQHASWPEFVRYLLDSNKKIGMDSHWEMFSKMCNPCALSFDYIVKLETISDDVAHLSKKFGFDFTPFFPAAVKKNRNNKWKTQYAEYFENLSSEERKQLYNMYAKQYELFDYPKPEFL
ncbi:carbohydrate sulfotransferase 11-like [Styela clava]